jgi:hypothetical protein
MPDTTPLWLAVEKRHEELALLLVERGANLERIVEPTFNVLTFAVTRQMVRLARRIAELEPRLIAQQMACNCDLLIGSCANSAFLPLTEHILANFSP